MSCLHGVMVSGNQSRKGANNTTGPLQWMDDFSEQQSRFYSYISVGPHECPAASIHTSSPHSECSHTYLSIYLTALG